MKAVKAREDPASSSSTTTTTGGGSLRMRRRRKVNRASPPTTLNLHGVRIHFPFRPYACQEEYMKKVIEGLSRSENALLESPTGTGKTLCLLCASLAWQREKSRLMKQQQQQSSSQFSQQLQPPQETKIMAAGIAEEKSKAPTTKRVPTIIYASRTHSQLSQVVRELQNTRYRPNHAVLGSREQMCVNPKVKKSSATTASDINHDCNKLGKDRRCKYRNNLEGFMTPNNEEGAVDGQQPVRDIEDLVKMGKTKNVCPFYYTRSQVAEAELILLPYNYLFDKDARDGTLSDVAWNNAVVIFDEAHNLESFASESASFDLSNHDIAGCIREVERAVISLQAQGAEVSSSLKMDNLLRVKAIFLKLENYILNLGSQSAYSGEFMMDVFQRGACITHANYELCIGEIRKVNDFLMDMRGSSVSSKGSPRLEHFALCLKRVFGHQLESRCHAKAAFYRVHVSPKPTTDQEQKVGRTISYWCFAPSIAMEELAGLNVRSIIVTSGTLSPLPSYTMELGLKFPHTLENPHIIGDDQILVRVVGKGVSGKLLSSSYERRKDGEYYSELGNTIVSLAKVTPAGMLIFFPSYGVMNTCLERWGGPASNYSAGKGNGKNDFFAARRRRQTASSKYSFPHTPSLFYDKNSPSTPWKRLLGTKAVVVEPKSSADLPDAISEFHRYLGMPKSTGCILMGVCRGKISEGIDFSHEQSRAVVITGLPFPPSHDPKVKMKREFLDQARTTSSIRASDNGGFESVKGSSANNRLSGNGWYTQQAHRAVNQAVGRVIRNNFDYGAVLLLDSRFDQSRNQEGLSKWLRPHIKKDTGVGSTIRSLVQFFKEADVIVTKKKKAQVEAVELEYEPEDDETMTKFAYVRPAPENDAQQHNSNDQSTTSYVAPEQVVARGDLKDVKDQQHPRVEPKLPSSPVVKKKPHSYASVFDAKPPVPKSGPPRASSSNGNMNPCARFFARAQKCLTTSDLNTLKKTVITMNTHAGKKDVRGFARSARDMVKLIINHPGFSMVAGGENLLLLFFPTVPQPFREDVEHVAMKIVFDNSDFGTICKELLPAGYHGLGRSCTVAFLRSLWCPKISGGMKTSDYIAKVQEIFRLFFKTKGCVSWSTVNALLKLVPSRYAAATQTLLSEMTATFRVENMRKGEKSKQGELSVKEENFTLPSWSARAKAGAVADGAEATAKKIEPAKAPSQPEQAIKSRHSSATKQKNNVTTGTKVTSTINPYARKRPASDSGAPSAASRRPRKSTTSLSSLIKTVEADTYVKRTPADLVAKLKFNAPKDINCPICSTAAKEPFVADCGHVACLTCWKSWLKRSETCPTCRVATTTKDIARVVYEDPPGTANNNKNNNEKKKKDPATNNSKKITALATRSEGYKDDDEDDEELEFF